MVSVAALVALLSATAADAQFGEGPRMRAGPAFGAASILIFNSKRTWIQVSEVVAIERRTGVNVAAARNGAHASARNQYAPNSGAENAIDSAMPPARSFHDRPGIYHSGTEGPPAELEITFAHPADLSRLTVYGRTDCCSDRDVYRFELLDRHGRILQSGVIAADNRDHAGTVMFDDSGRDRYDRRR